MSRAGRIAAALLIGFLVSILIVRNASVAAFASTNPTRAAKIWPGHPAVIMESGLAEVGRLAASGQTIEPTLVQRLLNAYSKAPLAPEPFLVRGVEVQMAGNERLAGQAFLAARDRNPREPGARYFLADHYLRINQTTQGLAEISALVRLVPQSLPSVAPYLAAYAREPGAGPQVKEMIQDHPRMEVELLTTLAADPRNLNLILYLWSGRGGDAARGWQARLLNELVAAGRFGEARNAWVRFTRISPSRDELFDPDFAEAAPPPFGWTLVSGPGGVAEPQAGGKLHVIYYGRDDLVLASQLLGLAPGRYQLAMKVSGSSKAAKALAWTVRCLPSGHEIVSIPLDGITRNGVAARTFEVPSAGCGAQPLELAARAPEFPEQVELTVSQLRLERAARP